MTRQLFKAYPTSTTTSILLLLLAGLTITSVSALDCPEGCECGEEGGFYVNCEDNLLSGIPDDIPEKTVTLIFTDNNISVLLGEVFTRLRNVQYIEFHGNPIRGVASTSFNGLLELTDLSLIDTELSSLPQNLFNENTNLTTLLLKHGKLTSLPVDLLRGLSQLITFDITGNELQQLPTGLFSEAVNLEHLSVGSNKLTTIPNGQFENQTKLMFLDLVRNKIATIGENVFSAMTSSLLHLSLENNELTTFPFDQLKGLTALTALNLAGNNLTTVPLEARLILEKLTELRLSGNPLICNEDLQWFQSWARNRSNVVMDIESLTCKMENGSVVKLMEYNFTVSGGIGHINVTAAVPTTSTPNTPGADSKKSVLSKKGEMILTTCVLLGAFLVIVCVLLFCFRKKLCKQRKQIKNFYNGNYNKVNRVV